jgi:hypothetical protein
MSGAADSDLVAGLLREFPRWAFWLPSGPGGWTAVRPASSRPPSAEIPMIWVHAVSAPGLRRKMREIDELLNGPAGAR